MAEENYVTISTEDYDRLVNAYDFNRYVRVEGMEEARLWCAANKGTATLEEGLKACTPDELVAMYNAVMTGHGWSNAFNWISELRRRLNARNAAAAAERTALAEMERIPLPEDEETEEVAEDADDPEG